MEKEFVPNTQALELKQLDFNEPCWAWYNIPDEDVRYCYSEGRGPITNIQEEWDAKIDNRPIENIGLPTFSQAFRFFRDKYKLHSTITSISQESWQWHITKPGESLGKLYDEDFYTYEEAELACIEKLIQIVKENGK